MTREDIETGLRLMIVACDAIRDAGRVPTGVLYAGMMSRLSKPAFDQMLILILRSGLVKEDNNVLVWIA